MYMHRKQSHTMPAKTFIVVPHPIALLFMYFDWPMGASYAQL